MASLIKFINAICDDIDSGIEVEITEKELSELTPEISLRNVLNVLLDMYGDKITYTEDSILDIDNIPDILDCIIVKLV